MEKVENLLTTRLLMQGKEVGSIIGKKGDNIKQIREQSGARITISDGSTPERIVTINGVVENANKAFSMICKKFEDDLKQTCNANSIPPITLRLIVPASQCGSIIGKGGSKIKEIREQTGASIQVASEMLPGSTERAVTVSGKLDSIVECFKLVSVIMLESPPKGDTLSYKPRQANPTVVNNAPIIFAHGQAYQVQGQYAIPLPPHEVAKLVQMGALSQVQPTGPMPPAYYYPEEETSIITNQTPPPPPPQLQPPPQQQQHPINPAATAAAVAAAAAAANVGGPPRNMHNVQTHEMTIPNDLIGCIIGRGGQKISEIRLVSGANIKIADLEDGNPDRHVSITGTPDQIQLAQFLINASASSFLTSATSAANNSSSSLTENNSNYSTSIKNMPAHLSLPGTSSIASSSSSPTNSSSSSTSSSSSSSASSISPLPQTSSLDIRSIELVNSLNLASDVVQKPQSNSNNFNTAEVNNDTNLLGNQSTSSSVNNHESNLNLAVNAAIASNFSNKPSNKNESVGGNSSLIVTENANANSTNFNNCNIIDPSNASNNSNINNYAKSLNPNESAVIAAKNFNLQPLFQPILYFQQKLHPDHYSPLQADCFVQQQQHQQQQQHHQRQQHNQQQQQQLELQSKLQLAYTQSPQQHQYYQYQQQQQYGLNFDLLTKASRDIKRNQLHFKPY